MKLRAKWIFPVLLAVLAVVLFILHSQRRVTPGGPVVQFCGAAREVGGSCHLVESGDVRFIVDCGTFGEAGVGVLPEKPHVLSFVLLTHAHGDHCGLLPELYAAGFRGSVYCTEPTAELVPIMLRMTRSISRKKIPADDFERAINGLVPVPFGDIVDKGTVSFSFRRAEHLLGSAFVEVWIDGGSGRVKLVFSGDLGSGNSLLLNPLEELSGADYVVMESTYGGTIRDYGDDGDLERHGPFAEAVGTAIRRGGDVLIPAFTLGRTQEVIAAIDLFSRKGVIPQGTITYVDSPTAKKITEVYRRFRSELSSRAQGMYRGEILSFTALREVKSRISTRVHLRNHRPAIFISSSGDLDHANSPRHFMEMFDDEKNLLCIVGWQSPGSLGSRLAAGESPVLVRRRSGRGYIEEWVCPALEVRRFSSFSAHADQAGLVKWLEGAGNVKRVFLVHGELDQMEALAEVIKKKMGVKVEIPRRGERFLLPLSIDSQRRPRAEFRMATGKGDLQSRSNRHSKAGERPIDRMADLQVKDVEAGIPVVTSPVERSAAGE